MATPMPAPYLDTKSIPPGTTISSIEFVVSGSGFSLPEFLMVLWRNSNEVERSGGDCHRRWQGHRARHHAATGRAGRARGDRWYHSGAAPAGRRRGGKCWRPGTGSARSEEHTSELQSRGHLVCRLLLEKKKRPSARTPRSRQP